LPELRAALRRAPFAVMIPASSSATAARRARFVPARFV
jgi:hypothetical protein